MTYFEKVKQQIEREEYVRQGRYFFASQVYSPTAPVLPKTGNRINSLLSNPANSGVNVFFTRTENASNVGANYPTLIKNPTGNLPTTPMLYTNANISVATPPKMIPKMDLIQEIGNGTGALSGGTAFGYSGSPGALLGGQFQVALPPILIPPGYSVGATTVYVGAITIWLVLEWWEEPIIT